jgi:hypothetical protein
MTVFWTQFLALLCIPAGHITVRLVSLLLRACPTTSLMSLTNAKILTICACSYVAASRNLW